MIQTTHIGSLPRPARLLDILDKDPTFAQNNHASILTYEIEKIVEVQDSLGLSFISDGEFSNISYIHYIKDRYSGFLGSESDSGLPQDVLDFS